MPREFPTAVAGMVTGASVRRLDTWARTGLLPPSGRPATGKGSRRSYTFQDLIGIRTIIDLRQRHCPLQQIRGAVAELRKLHPEFSNSQTLARLTLLTDGRRVYLITDETQAMDVLTRQTVWAVPLGRHIIETTERVKKLPPTWTEEILVGEREFHVLVTSNDDGNGFSAHCKELPGTLQHGATAEEAVAQLKSAVQEVRAFMARGHRNGAPVRRRAAN